MFGCVLRKSVFRAVVRRNCYLRFLDTICPASNEVIYVAFSGRFIYFVRDDTIQVSNAYGLFIELLTVRNLC